MVFVVVSGVTTEHLLLMLEVTTLLVCLECGVFSDSCSLFACHGFLDRIVLLRIVV